ncbi:molybdopterin molybdotransferase MoeA [Novosphingobium cyanobacteriorum]|uniref:Molybdopterin molybdenumtransferase n=1 Tax=Novosphingobium cyanobacteriorum TaxID=3024215 RepID=A0ABT6CKP9_9SPHN|nr:molybdopterin molybdotransferase MoeA [Novosphingobium cyanobacteriorum]MDF8334084.1 molybdopterin molybdotransferase MoeA [Novosphingobium cyanobacteriorum]
MTGVTSPPLSLEEAQRRLMWLAPQLPVEHRATAECAGFYLAHPISAHRAQPAAPLSAMDGYALRAADLPGPWTVVGESAAGHPFAGTVEAGQAVRISTGAILPAGADMVLLQEDAGRQHDTVTLTGTPPDPTGRHIRPAGMDFADGAPLLPAGLRLGAAQIALAIAGGHQYLRVRRPVNLTVIDSGDELGRPGQPLAPHQIPASNGPMLAAMAATMPVKITRIGPVPDDLPSLATALEAAHGADIVVTSGGASVGDHDLVRPALEAAGATIDFWRVAIKPGKPLLVARRNRPNNATQVILGLPGNPASAFVTGFLFLLPLLRAALGAESPLPRTIPARLAHGMPAGGSRTEFLRAHWDGASVSLDPLQDSGALSPLARANALVVRAARAPAVPAGTDVPVYLLETGGIA